MAERKGSIPHEHAVAMRVGDVMIARPKTLPSTATVADVRRAFERPNMRTVLLADEDGYFRGAIERDTIPVDAVDDHPAATIADLAPASVGPETPMTEALALLAATREPRLVVLDDDGVTLRGLVCVNADASGFCTR